MKTVKEQIEHILYHVNSEAQDVDPSQKSGVQDRAAYVRQALRNFEGDERKLEKYDLLREVSSAASLSAEQGSFRRVLLNLEITNHTSPQLALQEWVGRGTEGEKS